MQDVTTLEFMTVIGECGAPDWFVTEYFRVHSTSTLEKHILASITQNPTGKPVYAQMIGENVDDLVRNARLLERHPVAGVDLNMGCPAPKIYKKNVGGGLLRDPEHIARIFAGLRAAISGRFTVKMRIGFEDTANLDRILDLVNEHGVDLLTIHGRTVKMMYRGEPLYEWIAHAVKRVRCPVIANGNITSAPKAEQVLRETGAAGLMIGRSAIRNPWIFRQIREHFAGQPVFQPSLSDVRGYVERLRQVTERPGIPDAAHTACLKKFLNFVGQSVDPEGRFLHEMRRAMNTADLLAVCDRWLLENGRDALPFHSEPFEGILARPNREGPATCAEVESC